MDGRPLFWMGGTMLNQDDGARLTMIALPNQGSQVGGWQSGGREILFT